MFTRSVLLLSGLGAAAMVALVPAASSAVAAAKPASIIQGIDWRECFHGAASTEVVAHITARRDNFPTGHNYTITCHDVHHMNDAGHTFNDYTLRCIDRVLNAKNNVWGTGDNPAYYDIHLKVFTSAIDDTDEIAHVLVVMGKDDFVTAYTKGPDFIYGDESHSGQWNDCAFG